MMCIYLFVILFWTLSFNFFLNLDKEQRFKKKKKWSSKNHTETIACIVKGKAL